MVLKFQFDCSRKVIPQLSENFFTKSPLTPLCQRGELNIIPLWQRGMKGDFNIELSKPLNNLIIMVRLRSRNNFSLNWGYRFLPAEQ
jgi:hypothetical protein